YQLSHDNMFTGRRHSNIQHLFGLLHSEMDAFSGQTGRSLNGKLANWNNRAQQSRLLKGTKAKITIKRPAVNAPIERVINYESLSGKLSTMNPTGLHLGAIRHRHSCGGHF